jgi:hypothetical protein
MKIRVTIMTENDAHLEGVSKERIERTAQAAWQLFFDAMPDKDDAYVESCEVVEM